MTVILRDEACSKTLALMLMAGLCLFMDSTLAAETIANVADRVTSTFKDIAELVTAAAYLAGAGFFVAALLKFKQHKDNPTQIPIGTPIALLFIGAALVFMPTLIGVAGESVFGASKTAATTTGTADFGK